MDKKLKHEPAVDAYIPESDFRSPKEALVAFIDDSEFFHTVRVVQKDLRGLLLFCRTSFFFFFVNICLYLHHLGLFTNGLYDLFLCAV